MHKILAKLRLIEKSLGINRHVIKITWLNNESNEEALVRHLKENPKDAGKEYYFVSQHPTHEEFLEYLQKSERVKRGLINYLKNFSLGYENALHFPKTPP